MRYSIGKTVAVLGDTITVLLDEFCADESGQESGVPPSMSVNHPSTVGPVPLMIGQPGSFVDVAIPSGNLLCMVTEIRMVESVPLASDVRSATTEGEYLIPCPKRLLVVLRLELSTMRALFSEGAMFCPQLALKSLPCHLKPSRRSTAATLRGTSRLAGSLSCLARRQGSIWIRFWVDMGQSSDRPERGSRGQLPLSCKALPALRSPRSLSWTYTGNMRRRSGSMPPVLPPINSSFHIG